MAYDVLCFIKEKFANTPVKALKPMLIDFYTAELKQSYVLVVLLACLFERNPPHVPHRRGRL